MAGGPLGVLLRDQALESLRELAVAILAGVGPGLGQVQVTLVLERLGGGAVGDPVLLELVEVLATSSTTITEARPPVTHTGLWIPATTGSAAATASSSSFSHL